MGAGTQCRAGLGPEGHTARNLTERSDLVINVPDPKLWPAVERLAPLTGADPVPEQKRHTYRHERDKFAAAGLHAVRSTAVRPPGVAECPLRLEARAEQVAPDVSGEFLIVQARVVTVHADADIVVPDTQHIDPRRWSPLIYNFRHYFGPGPQLGHNFRSETSC